MKNGTKVFHPKYGPGELVGQSLLSTAVIVQFEQFKDDAAKVVKLEDLVRRDLLRKS